MIPKDEDEHQADTVPPPPGEDDAYGAETKIGQVPDDVLQAIKRAQANEDALKKLAATTASAEPAPASTKAPPEPPSAPATSPAAVAALAAVEDDDDDDEPDEAATMLRFSAGPDSLGDQILPPRDAGPDAAPVSARLHAKPDEPDGADLLLDTPKRDAEAPPVDDAPAPSISSLPAGPIVAPLGTGPKWQISIEASRT